MSDKCLPYCRTLHGNVYIRALTITHRALRGNYEQDSLRRRLSCERRERYGNARTRRQDGMSKKKGTSAAPGVVGPKPRVRRHTHDEGWVVSVDGRHNMGCGDVLYIFIPDRYMKGADE